LLSAAFVALRMTIPVGSSGALTPQQRLEIAWFEAGCAINTLRNKEGIGHGRPSLPTVTPHWGMAVIQQIGLIAAEMLRRL
jgi:hypothetical protein